MFSFSKMFKFRGKHKQLPNQVLNQRQLEILERELKESQESAMPSNTSSNMSSRTSLTTSKMFSVVNKRGLDMIIARRVLEPRKNMKKIDQENL